jgi:hypothetical protein
MKRLNEKEDLGIRMVFDSMFYNMPIWLSINIGSAGRPLTNMKHRLDADLLTRLQKEEEDEGST